MALGGIFVGATFAVAGSTFTLTLAGSDAISPPYFGTPATGTDVSAALGFSSGEDPTYLLGHDAESVVDALGELGQLASGTVAIMLAADAPLTHGTPAIDTRTAVAAYAQAGDFVFGLLETSAQALVANDATSHAALAFSRSQNNVSVAFDSEGSKPDIGLMALDVRAEPQQPSDPSSPPMPSPSPACWHRT